MLLRCSQSERPFPVLRLRQNTTDTGNETRQVLQKRGVLGHVVSGRCFKGKCVAKKIRNSPYRDDALTLPERQRLRRTLNMEGVVEGCAFVSRPSAPYRCDAPEINEHHQGLKRKEPCT